MTISIQQFSSISHLFEAVRGSIPVHAGTEQLTAEDIAHLKETMRIFVFDVLGLKAEEKVSGDELDGVMKLLLALRADAKVKRTSLPLIVSVMN